MKAESVDAQILLTESFDSCDLKKFRQALHLGANPNLIPTDGSGDQMSIFEKALSTPGYSKFIRACLEAGCDINYINPQLNKAAIHYAADSKDDRNFRALLSYSQNKMEIDVLYEGETTLHKLIKNLKMNSGFSSFNCIIMLFQHGASPNILDGDRKTALQYLLHVKEIQPYLLHDLLFTFLTNPKLNDANYCEGVQYILKNQYKGRILYWVLMRQLLNADDLLETLERYEQEIPGWDRRLMQQVLFEEYICNKKEAALNAIQEIIKVNSPVDNQDLLDTVIKLGNWTTCLRLMQNDKLRLESPGKLLMTLIQQVQHSRTDYQECLQQLILLDRDSCLETEDQGQTPTHYAVQYRNEYAIRALLRHGARLGWRNAKNKLIIEDMNVELLEEHFDYCITSRGDKPSHERYELIMNCMNLTNSQNELDLAPIAYMANSKEQCRLLQHPLITCILMLKWQRMSAIFYAHFLICMLFGISLTTYGLLRFPEPTQSVWALWLARIACCSTIVYMLIEDLSLYLMVKHVPSFIDVPLIVLLILTCLECGTLEIQRTFVILTIMLMACKLVNLLGALPVPAISTHMLMLRQVSRNFIISLGLFSILLLTFAIIFHIQFSEPKQIYDSDNFLTFMLPVQAVIKTLVMFSGEYEYTDFNSYISSLILLLFIFMTIIMTNLLGGLAVNDTQTIQSQVELNAAICRTGLLSRYEAALKDYWNNCDWLRRIFYKLAKIQVNISYGYVSIFPNQDNKAIVYSQRHRNQSLESLPHLDNVSLRSVHPDHEDGESTNEDYTNLRFLLEDIEITDNYIESSQFPFQKSYELYKELRIDNTTVNRALEIIKRNLNAQSEEQREDSTEKRLGEILSLLQEIKTEFSAKNP